MKNLEKFSVIWLIVLNIPFGMFLSYLFFLIITHKLKVKPVNVLVRRIFTIYSILICFSGLMFPTYFYLPDFFVSYNILYCVFISYTMIIYYHFSYIAVASGDKFKFIHYILPIPVYLNLFLISRLFPEFWLSDGNKLSFFTALIFGIIYTLKPLQKMNNFQLSTSSIPIDKSKSVPFIFVTIVYPLVHIVFPLIFCFNPSLLVILLVMFCLIVTLFMNIPLAYGIIFHYDDENRDYSPFFIKDTILTFGIPPHLVSEINSDTIKPTKTAISQNNRIASKQLKLNKRTFEQYFHKNKPYLNSKLTITDLVEPLDTNRTYLSQFVNKTYNLNFSSYINLCRLKEMERLSKLSSNSKKSIGELILQAGFSNYDSYYRAKNKLKDQLD